MRLVVTAEERLQRTPDGVVWSTGTFANGFWQRYRPVFDEVRVAARVLAVPAPAAGMTRVDGDGVSVWALPHYIGPAQFLRQRRALHAAIGAAAEPGDAVLVRAPSAIGTMLCAALARRGQPYGVEVVGDPQDVYAAGAVEHPLRPLFQRWFVTRLRRQCLGAAGAAYVTERSLQERYPVGPGAFTASYSSIELRPDAFVPVPREPATGVPRLVTVGSLEQLYKGTDILIEAVAGLRRAGLPVTLTVVGDGRYRGMLTDLAARLLVSDLVTFAGTVPAGAGVRARLDDADLFVLPSRAEGLPKAVLEAMARGLPCVASTVGGNPELLPAEDLVAPGDPAALTATLSAVLRDPERQRTMAARNLARARDYTADRLVVRREAFYESLRDATTGRLARR
jgi:phosphatidylinositol alpha-1,6-mannosyltransferase